MKINLFIPALMILAGSTFGQTIKKDSINKKDSIQIVNLKGIEVVSTRATNNTPVAFTNISKKDLKRRNSGKDLPYLLSLSPSIITTSDAGTGIGYTSMRVRGTDGTRINVTINGIPVNDAESHSVFFVNLPDFTSSVKNIQIQRGAGTSTNGGSAFGASVNMLTGGLNPKSYSEINTSFGSFNTHKETVKFGTGLINKHWIFSGRLSNIGTKGYIDRASANLSSYLLQAGYFDDNTIIKFITFNGVEETYHAWNYSSKEEMKKYGRTYNSCGKYKNSNSEIAFYDNQIDHYNQKNYQLLLNHRFNNELSINTGLHYTRGDGYYEEYKKDRTLSNYGLNSYQHLGITFDASDLVRRKQMANDFGGIVASINYKSDKFTANLGGNFNRYVGDHFGNVIWIRNYIGAFNPNHEYYTNQARKNDANIYAKVSYNITSKINYFLDLQYRNIDYKIYGSNDNFDWINKKMQDLDLHDSFNFFNPKTGINWNINRNHRAYASLAIAQKEPTRNNYTDGYINKFPTSEKMLDYEFGYQFKSSILSLGTNFYYMDYKDQLVLTGEMNEIGEAVSANVDKSYRMGVELILKAQFLKNWTIDANATFSKNKIKNFKETLYDKNYQKWEINHKETTIAFSPNTILNGAISYNSKHFNASFNTQYVSKQFMTNAEQDECSLDSYIVSNINLSYSFQTSIFKEITIGYSLNNVFNEEYENNGWAGSSFSEKNGVKTRGNWASYAAQAGRHFMLNLAIKF